jgi:hypothetical protein
MTIKIRPYPFDLKKSFLYVRQNVENTETVSSRSSHFLTTVNIAVVAGKNPKINRPMKVNKIHSRLRYASFSTLYTIVLNLSHPPTFFTPFVNYYTSDMEKIAMIFSTFKILSKITS